MRTQSGFSARRTFSSRSSIWPVWKPWVPDPTSRLMSGCGNLELPEEDFRHRVVVVLAGMDEQVSVPRLPQRTADRRDLDELRPGADDRHDLQRAYSVGGPSAPAGLGGKKLFHRAYDFVLLRPGQLRKDRDAQALGRQPVRGRQGLAPVRGTAKHSCRCIGTG